MWSPLVFCLLVGFTYALNGPAWKDNTEYTYLVNGRTLSSLHEASDQYSGILLKALLHLTPLNDGKLQGRITDSQYAQIHSHLPNGWNSEIPENQLSYRQLSLSHKPFQIVLEDGLITKLIVEQELTNWEANIIKSIVSQFQLDVQGKTAIDCPVESLPSNEKFNGVFKTMEETVTGRTETQYEVHPYPKYLLQSEHWSPVQKLEEQDQVIEVTKFKNYTNAEDRPSYHYGFGEIKESEPSSNKMGQFFMRESYSRAILIGQFSNFVINRASTVNKIFVNPTFNNKEMGSVMSVMNVTLSKMNAVSQPASAMTNPTEIGNLVYTYESVFSDNNKVHEKLHSSQWSADSSDESHERAWQRFRRSAGQEMQRQNIKQYSEETVQYQPRPEMKSAPKAPLLPYLMGYHGKSIKENKDFDIKQNVQQIVHEIAQEIENPQEIVRKSTLNRYTILGSLVRLMNEDEIKSVAEHLYTQSHEGQEFLAWVVFRDAVAEAGTGPAFLNCYEWIKSEKLQEYEAAQVVATMARSVRVPTADYMSNFFDMVKKPVVQKQEYLNETAILNFADLVYRVYINVNESHNQFPVHSFGSFYTKEGREFVKSSVIPYFTKQLYEAVSQADARKIHVYIRALGNVGHKKILEAFEPYLEGEKQVSQFQRMLMVMALDRLTISNPFVARSVLYKIFQNKGEIPEVRCVAVYQLMRTNPPVEMLQHMAESTHVEPQEQLVAAIKSVIETAALLKDPKQKTLQQAAESVKHLLTPKYYAGDYSLIDLRDYIIKNMKEEFDHKFMEIGSQDSNWPTIVDFGVNKDVNGLRHQLFSVSGMISSVRELMNVWYRQTEQYQENKNKRAQQQPGESKWSSANLAHNFNYQTEEREQLEAMIFAEMKHIQALWSIDNQTLERLPEVMRKQEELLKNGKKINYAKLIQAEEMALSFPTEMGIPFLYTYDMPLLVRFEGKVKALAYPQIVENNRFRKPEKISAEIDGSMTVSAKTQSHLSFVTPFDHQVYLAGIDKNVHAHLPIRANIAANIKDQQIKIDFEVKETEKDVSLLHYSTYPYTSRSDLLNFSPVVSRPNTKIFKPQVSQHRYFDVVFGKQETGMAFRAWGHHPAQSISFSELAQIVESEGFFTMWEHLWSNAVLQQTEANIAFVPSQSSTRKFTLSLATQERSQKQPEEQSEEDFLTYTQLASKLQNKESKPRLQKMIKHVESGIKSADASAWEASFEFEGDQKYQHILGVAAAKSNAGPKSRTVIYYKKDTKKPAQFAFQGKAYIPNTNGLDLSYALNTQPKATYDFRAHYGASESEASMFSGEARFVRSETRKQYLLDEEPMYRVCNKQMQEGNFQLPACQNMTIQANFFDDIKIQLQYEKVDKKMTSAIEGIFNGFYFNYYPMSEIRSIPSEGDDKLSLRIQFQPENFRQFNFTVQAGDTERKLFNISLPNHIVKTLVVPHPVFHLKSRAVAVLKGWENFRPTCVIDQTAAQTFSNKTYPLNLENKWTVAMQYIAQDARMEGQGQESVEAQLKRYHENYVVLIRQLSSEQKEILITLNHPETQGKTVEINLKPKSQGHSSGSSPAASVLVDSQEMQFDDKEIADLYKGYMQIYALPNGEVKIEFRDAFYLIFDGQRVKFTSTHDKLRDSIYGLCGRFSKDQYEDFTVPSNCVVKDPVEFMQSYWVDASQLPRYQRSNEWRKQCVSKVLPVYVDVISDRDAGRQGSLQRYEEDSSTMLRPRYIEENGEMCFTIRPLPTCTGFVRSTVSKNVPVHCVRNSKTAYFLKNLIDQGGNPDFSHKTESRTILMEVPAECN